MGQSKQIKVKNMEKPTHLKIVKIKGRFKGNDFFRLEYIQNGLKVASEGFTTKSQLAKIIKKDIFMKIEIN